VTRPKNPKLLLSGLALAAVLVTGCSAAHAPGVQRGTGVQPAIPPAAVEPTSTTVVADLP
jgi:hypothetical protein